VDAGYFAGKAVPPYGWNSVTVPFAKLFEPAISYGRNGFPVSPTIAAQWDEQVPLVESQPGFAGAFLPDGRAPRPGELFTFPEHAATLETIAATNGEALYRGELAAAMEAHARGNGGAMLAGDLAAHRADWVGTIAGVYRGRVEGGFPPATLAGFTRAATSSSPSTTTTSSAAARRSGGSTTGTSPRAIRAGTGRRGV
jgi:gamma-glutamyltranspeptidase / glutathione hydrolase